MKKYLVDDVVSTKVVAGTSTKVEEGVLVIYGQLGEVVAVFNEWRPAYVVPND